MWFATITPAFANWNTPTNWSTPTSTTPFTDVQRGVDIGTAWAGNLAGSEKLIDTIKTAINIILGLLGTISLVILLWGGFQMVTAAGDEGKHKKGFTILKQAGMGLIFIGLAALFVQLIFWFISSIAK